MVEEQSWPDDCALETLKEAAGEFEALDEHTRGDDLPEAVDSAVEKLSAAIFACEEAGIDKREILGQLGRARAVLRRSPFIARTQEWPRGYAGDYETIEYLCEAVNRAPLGTMEFELENLALKSAIGCQHRNKVAFQAQAMLSACKRKDGHPRILSVGSGGCRDIRSIANLILPMKAEFVLCDHDEEALYFALHALGPLAERCTHLNAMIPRVLRKLSVYGPFDLVVAGGVFDYLSDLWFSLATREIWHTLLAPQGELVFTNIKRGNPYRVWLEYFGNWNLTERDESEVVRSCTEGGIPKSAIKVQLDETGLTLMVTCQRLN
jgi:extracellular factor (EF) 3-hydroxypalmitic acid methyl ester biosynthesis protein